MDNRVMLMLAYFHLGRQRELLGTLDGAEAWLRENERWNEGPIAELAAGCLATELFERSVTLFDEAIALHVKSTPNRGVGDGVLSRYYRDQAGALSGLGRTDAAVDAAAGAIVSWGHDMGSRSAELQRLNEILAAAADLDAYIARLDAEVAETGLENPIVRKALGQVLAEQKRYGPAIQQLRLALAAQPNDAETGAQLVRTLDDAGQREQAAQAALERARLASHDVNLWCDVGERMRSLERVTDAERAFTNLAEMLPNESASHHRLAEARQSQLRWDEAARSWDQVVRIRPGEPTGYLGLARCLIEGGERQEAEQVLRKLESTDWPERFNNVPRETEQLRKRLRRTN